MGSKSDFERLKKFTTVKDKLTTCKKGKSSKSREELLDNIQALRFHFFACPMILASGLPEHILSIWLQKSMQFIQQ